MSITLPDDVMQLAERQAKAAGFASVDEYVADLVREDELEYPDLPPMPGRSFSTREELERLLDEAKDGPWLTMDEEFWKWQHQRLMELAARTGKTR